MADEVKAAFGTVDVLVASAGVGGSQKFFVDSEPEDWDLMLAVNVRGILNTNRAIAPLMVEAGSGSIINIASEAGKVGEKRIVVYSATKGAVISFSKAFALEMGRYKVRVNAVCPGVTMTAMTEGYGGPGAERYEAAAKLYPMGRLGEPEDIASMITYLASDQSTWLTGQAISVNGGFGRS
ncbi:MAG: SDR family oxidoreductase [Candidatus Hydrogenedentes bacterium]|nr:SDR family oxidoreductase [Candidatus Hydrogenedentota bacterium]